MTDVSVCPSYYGLLRPTLPTLPTLPTTLSLQKPPFTESEIARVYVVKGRACRPPLFALYTVDFFLSVDADDGDDDGDDDVGGDCERWPRQRDFRLRPKKTSPRTCAYPHRGFVLASAAHLL